MNCNAELSALHYKKYVKQLKTAQEIGWMIITLINTTCNKILVEKKMMA